jgi:hypothetical protein
MTELCEVRGFGENISVSTYYIPDYLEDITNKKINNIALRIFEQIVDWLASWLYAPYNTLFDVKTVLIEIGKPNYPITATSLKIHRFMDGTPLYDMSCNKVAGVLKAARTNPPPDDSQYIDYITLKDKRVLISNDPTYEHWFCKEAQTKYIVVEDVTTQPINTLFHIIEQEFAAGNNNARKTSWTVDTNKNTVLRTSLCTGQITQADIPVYIVENPHRRPSESGVTQRTQQRLEIIELNNTRSVTENLRLLN